MYRTGRTTTWTSEGCHKVLTAYVAMTFFLFSKCLGFFTHSHNASAVSLIFFCDSEYDQSLVPRSRFLFGQHKERPDICAWQKGILADEIETLSDSYVCWGNVKSSVPCLGKGSVLMDLYWLPAGQRVDFKMHSNTFKLGFLTSTSWYVSHCPTTDLVKIFSPCRH